MDIKTSTINDLKALVYDSVAEIERLQGNIKAINEELSLRANAPKEMPEAPVEVIKKSK